MTQARWIAHVVVAAALASVVPASAQDLEESQLTPVVEALLGALQLPQVVSEAREAGVTDSTLTGLIDRFRDSGLRAAEAEDVLDQEMEVVRAGGPVDNFGAFVQTQLEAGLRGRDLAAAIRAEHRSRGIGIAEGRPDRVMGERGRSGRGARGRGGAEDGRGEGRGRGARGGR